MDMCAVDQQWSDINESIHPPSDTNEWIRPRREEHPAKWFVRRPTIVLLRAAHHAADVSSRFEALRRAWHREYGASSSLTKIASSPSYREIIRLKEQALPLIFHDLKQSPEPDHWFQALMEITGADPVPPKDRGNRRRMAKAWLLWARSHGHAP
jgi:hypothetical protein